MFILYHHCSSVLIHSREDILLIGHQAMESLDFYVRVNQVHYAWKALTR